MHSATRYQPELPPHVPPALVHDFDIYDPGGGKLDHYAALRQLHACGAPDILWTRHNGGHWIVVRGDYISAAARDHATFSSTRMAVPDEFNFTEQRLLPIMADPPEHTVYRKLIATSFTPRAIGAYEPEIRALAISLIEDMRPRGACNFIDDFALHLPINIFMRMVDLPQAHRPGLLALVHRIEHPSEEKRDDVLQLIMDYLAPVIAARKLQPGSDLISQLAQASIDGRPLNDTELHQMCALLLLGGLDTVASSLGLIANFLATSPAHRKDLAHHPELIPNAVEELLRRFPTVTGPGRYIMKDVVFNGVQLAKGDHIILPRALYNFDDRLFHDPMTVDFRRPNPIHASFGTAGGVHRCPGSFLARTEIRIFLEEWLQRIPDFSIQPGAAIKFDGGFNVSVRSLPLAWPVA